MSFWISICRERRLGKSVLNLFLAIGCSIITLFFAVEIFTLGHWGRWFSDTFGTGGYQAWYYNSGKSYYLYDVDFSYIMLIQVGLAVFYMVKLFMTHG